MWIAAIRIDVGRMSRTHSKDLESLWYMYFKLSSIDLRVDFSRVLLGRDFITFEVVEIYQNCPYTPKLLLARWLRCN